MPDTGALRTPYTARGRMISAGTTPASTWNVANLITIVRILLVPVFVWLLFADGQQGGVLRWLATLLFVVAIATDSVDGHLARGRNLVTTLGILLDPIADRVFVLAAVGTFVAHDALSPWQAVALLVRDVMTVVGFFVARGVAWLRRVRFRARPLGKLVTGFQLATLFALILVPRLASALVVVVLLLAIAATVDYTLLLWRERAR